MDTPTVILLGNPKLRLLSEHVNENEFDSPELHSIVNSLFSAMEHYTGSVGLAAPQIGINKRIVVFGMEKHPVYSDVQPIPYTALINPTIEFLTEDTEENYEGCVSVGALRGKVQRYKRILYKGFDVKGNLIEREVDGLHARVVQHECDHLDGIIFLDLIKDHASLGFHEELVKSGQLKLNKQTEDQ